MLILNQDRDQLFFKGTKPLIWHEVYYKELFCGWNLLLGKDFLGTFDTTEEAAEEVKKINSFEGEIYAISGYSDYEGSGDLEEILQELFESVVYE